VIVACKTKQNPGDVIEFFEREYGDGPSAMGMVLREATFAEFMAADHPGSTAYDMECYRRNPLPHHYEVSTD